MECVMRAGKSRNMPLNQMVPAILSPISVRRSPAASAPSATEMMKAGAPELMMPVDFSVALPAAADCGDRDENEVHGSANGLQNSEHGVEGEHGVKAHVERIRLNRRARAR